MEMKPILQSSLFQLKVFEISFGLVLPCLLAAPRHAARQVVALGRKCQPKPQEVLPEQAPEVGLHIQIFPHYFVFKLISSLLSLFSLLRFYFWGSTLSAVMIPIHPPGLLGWPLAITSLMHLFSSSW